MTRLSRWSRFLTMLVAAVQFALPAALSVTDALIAVDGRTATAHVEDTTRTACRPTHSADCVVCQYISVPVVAAAPDPIDVPRQLRSGLAQFEAPSAESLRGHGFLSRAPPSRLG